ncbi:MAG: YjzC family protein [Myxococcota bacterium]|jgi:hypothetical protein|nr:YjzC family protein [Myxococcota bacterium]
MEKQFQSDKDPALQAQGPQPAGQADKNASSKLRNADDELLAPQLNPEQQQQDKAQVPDLVYGNSEVDAPSLMRIKLAVLAHPSFKSQRARLDRLENSADAYILFYWTVIQHRKFPTDTAVSEFRNAIFQRGRADRFAPTAQWLAQASKDEYTPREIVEYLTGRHDKLENDWRKDMVQTDNEAELELATSGEYKDWGRVSAQGMGYFPLIDFVKGEYAVSLKTVDPYDPAAVERIKAHMDELSARKVGQEVQTKNEDGKEEQQFKAFKLRVDLRVPPKSEKKVKELVEYGKALDIDVKITPYGVPLMEGLLRPGHRPPEPGEYVEKGPHGEDIPNALRVTMENGDEVLPPTSAPDRVWKKISPPKPELAHPAHEKLAADRKKGA